MKNRIYIFITILVFSFVSSASTGTTGNVSPSDSVRNTDSTEMESNEKSKTDKKKKRKRKRREKIIIDKEASMALHESMLTTGDHKHGFSHLKVHRGKGPLKPQTFCPVMGGHIDKMCLLIIKVCKYTYVAEEDIIDDLTE